MRYLGLIAASWALGLAGLAGELPPAPPEMGPQCERCGDTGKIRKTCDECHGRGRLRCRFCYGKGKDPHAGATGIIVCKECRGYGYKSTGSGGRIKCEACGGAGAFRCPKCKDGWIPCPKCNGKGKIVVPCPDCLEREKKAGDPELRINRERRILELKLEILKLEERLGKAQAELKKLEAERKAAEPEP